MKNTMNQRQEFNFTLMEQITAQIILRIKDLSFEEFALGDLSHQQKTENNILDVLKNETKNLGETIKERIEHEFSHWGPIQNLLSDPEITEILINDLRNIYFEKMGRLEKLEDIFYSTFTYERFVQRICDKINTCLTLENPFCDGQFENYRVSLIDKSVTHNQISISFRKHPLCAWNFEKLLASHWCTEEQFAKIKRLIHEKKNMIVIGTTGSGKTSVLNSLLKETEPNERSLVIEDTSEIVLPNTASIKLLTRDDPHGVLGQITQNDLVRRALRLRPDRIIMGEIRGSEAKDFLMALSTGHLGSIATLHANDAHQALIRLEMLIQIGAPQWNLNAIRRLISLSLDNVLVVGKDNEGKRKLKGVFEINSLEEHGFLIDQIA